MVNLSLCCAYFVGMDAAVKDEASHFSNVKVLSTDAKGDVAKLTSDVEDLLNQNVDGSSSRAPGSRRHRPRSKRSTRPACRSSWSIDCSRAATFNAWVGPDNRAIGEGIGDYIVKRLDGKGKVAIIRGGPADNTIGSDRSDGVQVEVRGHRDRGGRGARLGRMERRRRLHADGGHALQERRSQRRVLRERLHVPRRAEGDRRRRQGRADLHRSVDGEMGTLKEIMRDGSNYGATGRNSSDQIGRAGFNRAMAISPAARRRRRRRCPRRSSPRTTRSSSTTRAASSEDLGR